MKTFRCVFHAGDVTKSLDVVAPNPLAALDRLKSAFPKLPIYRVELEDAQGRLIPSSGFAGGPTQGRARIFPAAA